jgi:hypothetical protein
VMFPLMSIMVPLTRSGSERVMGEKLESFNCSTEVRDGRERLCYELDFEVCEGIEEDLPGDTIQLENVDSCEAGKREVERISDGRAYLDVFSCTEPGHGETTNFSLHAMRAWY